MWACLPAHLEPFKGWNDVKLCIIRYLNTIGWGWRVEYYIEYHIALQQLEQSRHLLLDSEMHRKHNSFVPVLALLLHALQNKRGRATHLLFWPMGLPCSRIHWCELQHKMIDVV